MWRKVLEEEYMRSVFRYKGGWVERRWCFWRGCLEIFGGDPLLDRGSGGEKEKQREWEDIRGWTGTEC